MNLIVVESPTKARTLSRFLGKDYDVEATMGHIKDLPKSKLSVDVENNFKPDYVIVEKKADVITKIKKASKKASYIFIATDPDREGEAIAKHVEEILKENGIKKSSDKVKRIVFHEITKGAVEEAISHPGKVSVDRVNAQIARRVLDRLVGYKLSPLLWKKVRRGLSAGRVQSVAVRLIVEKEREIEAFKPEEYWEIYVDLKTKNKKSQEFRVGLVKINDKKKEIKDKAHADDALFGLNNSDYKVFDVRKKEVSKGPYAPFTTSTMTQAGARLFGWSAKKTMSLAQKLYEEGLITYHRTDSTFLAISAVNNVRKFIKEKYGEKYLPEKPRLYKTKSKLAQEAHEAIRPTNVKSDFKLENTKFASGAEKLYQLIKNRFIACQMANTVFDRTTIDVIAKSKKQKDKEYLLRATGQVMLFDGWRKVIPLTKEEEPQLPNVEKGDPLQLIKVNTEQKFTQPPARYNEASLIKTLEKLGIGRPSTYAPIITTIQIRSYVEKDEGKFKPTPVGVAVNDFLVKNFSDIFDYSFTADMEDSLDEVADGKKEWQKMMGDFYKPFEKTLEKVEEKAKRVKIEAEKLGKKCPTCANEGRTGKKQGELVVRTGRFGKFISCSLFPKCKHTEKYEDRIGVKCPECKKGEVIVKPTRKGRKFYGCNRYPKCEWASWKKPGSPTKEENK